MDATLVAILQGILSLVVAGLGWWLKTLHDQHREVERDLQAHKVEVAKEYATSEALSKVKADQAEASRDVFSAINSLRIHVDEGFNRLTTIIMGDRQAMTHPINDAGVELIKRSEACKLTAYPDSGGIWTIGWGHTGKEVQPGMRITQEEADRLFEQDIRLHAADVMQACTIQPTGNQLAALTSFAYNCRGWRGSSVIRLHNQGDYAGAARAFNLWVNATIGGKLVRLNGLVTRRAAEAALYLTPDAAPLPEERGVPHAEPPPPLSRSREMIGAAAAALPATLPAVVEKAQQIGALRSALEGLGPWMPYVGLLALVGIGFFVWARWTRRAQGVA